MTVNGITYKEFDRDALVARRPQVALIDELAHTNAPGSIAPKRFQDVLAVLRAGIDVITTLNIQHLEGLSDTVFRLTGTVVRETLPDGILTLADDVVLIDVTPETLRQRLREGKIYPPDRIESALANFFRSENLFALRELALREALRARHRERIASPFERILLAVGSREHDLPLITRANRIAARLAIDFADRPRRESELASESGIRRAAAGGGAEDERRVDRRGRGRRAQTPARDRAFSRRDDDRGRAERLTRHAGCSGRRSHAGCSTPARASCSFLRVPQRARAQTRRTNNAALLRLEPSSARLSSRTLTRGSPRNRTFVPARALQRAHRPPSTLVPRACATRGASQYAASGVMSGSMPLPLEVTRSIGGGPTASGFSFSSDAIVAFVASISFFDVRPEVRAAGCRRIVSFAGGRRPAVKILRFRPELPDDRRADDFTVYGDERSVRLPWKERLRDSGHYEGIDQPEHDDRDDRHAQRRTKMPYHVNLYLCQVERRQNACR